MKTIHRLAVSLIAAVLGIGMVTAPASADYQVPPGPDADYVELYSSCQSDRATISTEVTQLRTEVAEARRAAALFEGDIERLRAQQEVDTRTIKQLGATVDRKDARIRELWKMLHAARR